MRARDEEAARGPDRESEPVEELGEDLELEELGEHGGGAPARAGGAGAAGATAPAQVLRLQRTAGNRAVVAMLHNGRRPVAPAGPVLARRTRTEAAIEAYTAAVDGDDWIAAAEALGRMPRDRDIIAQLNSQSGEAIEAVADAASNMRGHRARRVYRIARWILADPGAPAEHEEFTIAARGRRRHSERVGGGRMTVRTGTEATAFGTTDIPEGFTFRYSGAEAGRTRWLQFIWREVIVEHPDRGRFRVDEEITTSGGTYRLTTNPRRPNYNTDSADDTSPFYETSFASNRTADSTTILDQPGPMTNIVNAQFDGGARRVISRAHFVTYLVRDYNVLHETKLDVEWRFRDRNVPPRRQTVSSSREVSRLRPRIRRRLIAEFPDHDYLP